MSEETTIENGQKMPEEMAELEFDKWCEAMGLEDTVDVQYMNAEEVEDFKHTKRKIIKGLMSGVLTINDKSEITFYPKFTENGETIHFHTPTGAVLAEADRKKEGQNIGKIYAMAASITKKNAGYFSKLALPDAKMVISITSLFLA